MDKSIQNKKINMTCPYCNTVNRGIEENYYTGASATFCKVCGKYIKIEPWTTHKNEVF